MVNKVKILHIIKSLGRGGAEMLLPETLKFHDQSRFEFHYLYFLPWKNQMEEEIRRNGGRVACLASSNNIEILMKFWAVRQYIKANQIDLVHCHLPWAGILGRFIHEVMGIPVLYTEHNKQERYHFITRWMNRLTFNWQTRGIAVSTDVADSIRKNIRVRIVISEVLNGVNTSGFRRDVADGQKVRRQVGVPQGAVVVGTIAVFRSQKRLVEWLLVFKTVSAQYPDLFGVIVGDGPLKAELNLKVKELGLEDRIIMPGLQTDVKPWLASMDIFMMSSVFEGLPIALLEAMSMQCAVVATDAGGIKEVIESGRNGLLVDVDSWMNLAIELGKLIANLGLRATLAMAARERIIEKFGIDRMARELEDLYQLDVRSNATTVVPRAQEAQRNEH